MKATKKRGLLFLLVLISLLTLVSCTPKDPETVTLDIQIGADESCTKTVYVYFGNEQIGSLTAGGSFCEKVEAVKDEAYDLRVSDNDSREESYFQIIVRADESKTIKCRVSIDDFGDVRIQKVE